MDETTKKAAQVRGPGLGEVFAKSASSTAGSIDLTAYAGRWISMQAISNDVYVLLAATQTPAEALDDTATSTTTQCWCVPAGTTQSFELDIAKPWLGFKCASGKTGTLRVCTSSDRIPN